MRRLLILGAVVLVAVGCGEDAAQHAARVAVQERVGGRETHCTQTARQYVTLIETTIYICIVDRADSRCDSYVATRHGRRFAVRLRSREVDCLLPTG